MRILTLTSSYPKHTGDTTAPFIESITRALADRGHELALVMPARSDLAPDPVRGVKFYPYRYAPAKSLEVFGYAESLRGDVAVRRAVLGVAPLAVLAGSTKAARLARREHFDVIHAHWLVPGGAMALPASWLTGLPAVVSLHGSDVFLAEKSRVLKAAARVVLRRAAAVTACSDDLAERSMALGALERPVTIPYGVSTPFFQAPAHAVRQLRLKLGLSPTAPVVLAVGRLVHKKGFLYLVEATPRLVEAHPDLHVLIAGRGDLAGELEDRARRLGVGSRVRLLGNVDRRDLPACYGLATVVALPSIRDDAGNVDGLPNVLLEGMASGTPLVASAVGGIPQAVRDGIEAILVAERDPDGLARAILELLGSPERREQMARAAQSKACDLFDWERVGERFEDVFRSVTSTRRAPR